MFDATEELNDTMNMDSDNKDIENTDAVETSDGVEDDEETTDFVETSDIAESDAPKKRWYVVQAFSGYEARVKKTLLERIELEGFEDRFDEILVPTEEVVEMKAGQKRRSERKFFPGYVLIKMVMDDETWHLVRKTPKVNGFIGGTSDKPAPIPEKEVKIILDQMEQGADKPKPKVIFEPGEVVRVIDGPFTDFDGEVEEVDYEKTRLKVAVSIFGRATPVELGFDQVEKA